MQISLLTSGQSLRFQGKTPPALALTQAKRVTDLFVKLAKVDTMSKETTEIPSSKGQWVLGEALSAELKKLGLEDINIDKHGVVTGTLPSNLDKSVKKQPTIGFFAHMDTTSDAPSDNVRPQIHRNYAGGDIKLKEGTVIAAKDLKKYKGEDIITSDGRTLLGADDKAGIAEIIEALWVLKENPQLKHPRVRVAFTPDEETQGYIDQFDVQSFGADAAYTLDGGAANLMEYESFNAYNLKVAIEGVETHPGYAKNKMVNATRIAARLVESLPMAESPEQTSGYAGFFHPWELKGTSAKMEMALIIRDFDDDAAKARVQQFQDTVKALKKEFPKSKINVHVQEAYKNMGVKMADLPEVVAYAQEGLRRGGLKPRKEPIRGGTDGSTLSWKGLPCPNLGAEQNLIHSRKEFVTVQGLQRCAANIVNILGVWAEKVSSGEFRPQK